VLRSFTIEAGTLRPLPAHPASGLPPEAVWVDLVDPTPEELQRSEVVKAEPPIGSFRQQHRTEPRRRRSGRACR
jgi:hypothetical protein